MGEDRLLESLAGQDLGLALDAATGKAPFLLRLASALPARGWIALDSLPAMLVAGRAAVAQALPDATVLWLRGGVETLPIGDGTLDTACLSCSLHHLADPVAGLRELLRVLKTGGRLIVNEMVSDGLDERQVLHRETHHLCAAIDRARGQRHDETLPLERLRGLFDELPLERLDWVEQRYGAVPVEDLATLQQLESVLDLYVARAAELEDGREIAVRAEGIKARMRRLGWGWATQWTAVGRKES